MTDKRCRARHFGPDVQCERERDHDGWHRAEYGEPVTKAAEKDTAATVVSWIEPP